MGVDLLTYKDEPTYQTHIENNPSAGFEFTLEWRNILDRNFGFKSRHLICKNETGKICGVLPLFKAKSIFGKRIVSTPYAIYSGILAESEIVERELLNFAKQLAVDEKVSFLEIREKETKNHSYSSEFVEAKKVYNFSLDISSNIEEVWKKLPKSSVRWGIKKARNSGLSYMVGNSKQDLNVFYDLFLQTRKFRGVPSYPYQYFKDIVKNFKVQIYTTKLNERPIASIFLIYYKKEMRYAFAGAIHEKKIMSLQPYHLILWQAIEDACRAGYTLFNLGGATLSTNDGGLYEFKKKWADIVTEVPSYFYLLRAKKLPDSDNQLIFRIASSIWKRLPLSLIKLLSPKVIKQFV